MIQGASEWASGTYLVDINISGMERDNCKAFPSCCGQGESEKRRQGVVITAGKMDYGYYRAHSLRVWGQVCFAHRLIQVPTITPGIMDPFHKHGPGWMLNVWRIL